MARCKNCGNSGIFCRVDSKGLCRKCRISGAEDSVPDRSILPNRQAIEADVATMGRPRRLKDFFGQDKIKENLAILIEAARVREQPLDHVLLYGPPGLGKTTLAHIVAAEMETGIRITSGPVIEKTGDFAAIVTNLQDGDILFIDEIHRLKRTMLEILCPAMEDRVLDLVIGAGPSARSVRLSLPAFTVLGETTRLETVAADLRSRFGAIYQLDLYSVDAMEAIVKHSASMLGITITEEAARETGKRSRGTPKLANQLLRRARDYAQVKSDGRITRQMADAALKLYGVDSLESDVSRASNERKRIPDDVKVFVWKRDGGRCVECGSKEKLEYDHIIPVSKGGSSTARNLQLLCEKCNRSKGVNLF